MSYLFEQLLFLIHPGQTLIVPLTLELVGQPEHYSTEDTSFTVSSENPLDDFFKNVSDDRLKNSFNIIYVKYVCLFRLCSYKKDNSIWTLKFWNTLCP